MRSTRMRKFRKKYQPLIISFKVVLVLYLVLFSMSYVTSDTVAYFDSNNKNVSTIMISAGTWEDEPDEIESDETEDDEEDEEKAEVEDTSSLSFVEQELTHPQTCQAEIEVEVTNDGEGPMVANAFYEVFYIENGNPKEDGEKLILEEDEGIIEVLEQGATQKLVYETSQPGFYQFVVYQDEDASEDERVWSEIIEVVCEDEQEDESEEQEPKEEKNSEESSENSTTEFKEAVNEEPEDEKESKEEKNRNEKSTDEESQEDPEPDTEKSAAATKEKDVESDEKKENNEVDE